MKPQDKQQNQQKLNRIKEELLKYREAKKINENHFLPQYRMQDNVNIQLIDLSTVHLHNTILKQAPQSCKEFNRRQNDDNMCSSEMKQQIIKQNQQEVIIQREITLADLSNFELQRQSIELANENWKQALMMQETETVDSEELTFEGLKIKHQGLFAGLEEIQVGQTKKISAEVESKNMKIQTNSSQFRSPQAHGNININKQKDFRESQGKNGNNLIINEGFHYDNQQDNENLQDGQVSKKESFEESSQNILPYDKISEKIQGKYTSMPNDIHLLIKGSTGYRVNDDQLNLPNCTSTKKRLNHLSLQISGEMGFQTTAASSNSNNTMNQMSQCSTGLISCRNPQETEKEQNQQMSLLSSANTLQSLGSQKFQLLLNSNECIPCNYLPIPTPMDYPLDLKNTSFSKLNKLIPSNTDTTVDQTKNLSATKSLIPSKAYSSCNSTPKQQSVSKKISLISEKSETSTKNSDKSQMHFAASNQKKQASVLYKPVNYSTIIQSSKNSNLKIANNNNINASFNRHQGSNLKNQSPIKYNLNNFSCRNSNFNSTSSNKVNSSNLQNINTKKEGEAIQAKPMIKKNNFEPYFKSARAQDLSNSFKYPSNQFEKLSEVLAQKDQIREENYQLSENVDSKSQESRTFSGEEENWKEEQKKWRIFGSEMIKAYEQLSENFNKVINEKRKQEMEVKESEITHYTGDSKNISSGNGFRILGTPYAKDTSNSAQTNPFGVSESVLRLQYQLNRNQLPGMLHQDLQVVLAELDRLNRSNLQLTEKCSQVQTAVEAHLNQSSQLADHVIHLRTQLDKASTHPALTPQVKCQSDRRVSHISSSSKTVKHRIEDPQNILSSEFKLPFPSYAALHPEQGQRQQLSNQ